MIRYPLHSSPLFLLSGVCLGVLVHGLAQAEDIGPYYLGATLRSTYNSNVAATRVAQRDTINSAGIRLGLDQSLGRQKLLLDLNANTNRFRQYDRYNHTDYALTGRLDWETIENLSGTFNAGVQQSRYVDNSTPQNELNLLRSSTIGLQGRLGELTALTFEAGLAASRNRYSAQNYRQNDLDQQALNAGVRFRPMGGVALRTGLRHTEARYPNYFGGADSAKRNDLEFSVDARVTGASTLNGRVALTRESHSAAVARDYHSWTGNLGWTWRPTGKLKLGLNMSRDSNVGAADYNLNLLTVQSNDSKISNKLALSADWDVTSVISLNAGWSESRRTLDNSFSVQNSGVSASAADRTTAYQLGLRYMPVRNVELGCSVSVTERSTSDDSSTLTYAYKQSLGSCYGQFMMR